MVRKRNIILYIITAVILCSCKDKTSFKEKVVKNYNVVQRVYSKKEYTVKFNFPDTIYRDSVYLGAIFYENIIDTINSRLNEDNERQIIYRYQLKNNVNPIDIKKCDTMYGFLDKGKLIFANEFIFNDIGVNYIDGYIEDNVYLKQKGGDVRWIQNKYRVAHELFVIEK